MYLNVVFKPFCSKLKQIRRADIQEQILDVGLWVSSAKHKLLFVRVRTI